MSLRNKINKLSKDVKCIKCNSANSGGPTSTLKYEYLNYTDSQIITLSENYSDVSLVLVSNGGTQKNIDWVQLAPNQIDFLGNLEEGDTIYVQYQTAPVGMQAFYLKTETYNKTEADALLDLKINKPIVINDKGFLVTDSLGNPTWDIVRNNGLTVFNFQVLNDIVFSNNAVFNMFNSTNGIFSANGTLTVSGDSWDRVVRFNNEEFITPDAYLHSKEPYQPIETDIFTRIPTVIGGAVVRGIIFEIRRRTPVSPVVPVAIPNREVETLTNTSVTTSTLQRLPTRSEGVNDNYYVYGYSLYIINNSGASITIPAGGVIRIEILNHYKKPISFNTLTSPNL